MGEVCWHAIHSYRVEKIANSPEDGYQSLPLYVISKLHIYYPQYWEHYASVCFQYQIRYRMGEVCWHAIHSYRVEKIANSPEDGYQSLPLYGISKLHTYYPQYWEHYASVCFQYQIRYRMGEVCWHAIHSYRVEKIANSPEDGYQSLPLYGISKLHTYYPQYWEHYASVCFQYQIRYPMGEVCWHAIHSYRVEKNANSPEDGYQSLPLYGISKLHIYYPQYWEHYASVCFQYQIRYRMGEVCWHAIHSYRVEKIANSPEDGYQSLPLYGISKLHTYYPQYWEHYASVCFQYQIRYRMGEVCWHAIHSYRVEKNANSPEDGYQSLPLYGISKLHTYYPQYWEHYASVCFQYQIRYRMGEVCWHAIHSYRVEKIANSPEDGYQSLPLYGISKLHTYYPQYWEHYASVCFQYQIRYRMGEVCWHAIHSYRVEKIANSPEDGYQSLPLYGISKLHIYYPQYWEHYASVCFQYQIRYRMGEVCWHAIHSYRVEKIANSPEDGYQSLPLYGISKLHIYYPQYWEHYASVCFQYQIRYRMGEVCWHAIHSYRVEKIANSPEDGYQSLPLYGISKLHTYYPQYWEHYASVCFQYQIRYRMGEVCWHAIHSYRVEKIANSPEDGYQSLPLYGISKLHIYYPQYWEHYASVCFQYQIRYRMGEVCWHAIHSYRVEKNANSPEDGYQSLPLYGISKLHTYYPQYWEHYASVCFQYQIRYRMGEVCWHAIHSYRVEKIANSPEDGYQSLPLYGISKLHTYYPQYWEHYASVCFQYQIRYRMGEVCWHAIHSYRVEKIANSPEDSYQSLPLYGISKLHTYYPQYWEHYASVCFQYQIRYRMGEVRWHAIHSYRVEKIANSPEDSYQSLTLYGISKLHTYYPQYWEHYASMCFQYQIRYRMGEVRWHAIHSYRVEKIANSPEDSYQSLPLYGISKLHTYYPQYWEHYASMCFQYQIRYRMGEVCWHAMHSYRVEKNANSPEDSYQSLPLYGISKLHTYYPQYWEHYASVCSQYQIRYRMGEVCWHAIHSYRVEKIANSPEDGYQSLPLYGISKLHIYYPQYWEHYASVCFQYQIRYRMGEVCWHAIHSYRVEKNANSPEDGYQSLPLYGISKLHTYYPQYWEHYASVCSQYQIRYRMGEVCWHAMHSYRVEKNANFTRRWLSIITAVRYQ